MRGARPRPHLTSSLSSDGRVFDGGLRYGRTNLRSACIWTPQSSGTVEEVQRMPMQSLNTIFSLSNINLT